MCTRFVPVVQNSRSGCLSRRRVALLEAAIVLSGESRVFSTARNAGPAGQDRLDGERVEKTDTE
ncbi:hypothetical protein [Halovenus amylolytica]|uniref:hypothetical protein n=1 Tax=Halovenus amylolytica TaxID=2500550 RepID=UPI003F57AD9D